MKRNIWYFVTITALCGIWLSACSLFRDRNKSNQIDIVVGDNDLSKVKIIYTGSNTITVEASWVNLGKEPITEYGFVLSKGSNPMPGTDSTKIISQRATVGAFSAIFSGLDFSTDYYVRAYGKVATNPSGVLGDVVPLRTLGLPPVVRTGDPSLVDTDKAQVSGEIIGIGSSPIIEYGHVWATSDRPTVGSAFKTVFAGPVDSGYVFSSDMRGLQNGVEYFYRAYAMNGDSLSYGQTRKLKTESLPFIVVSNVRIVTESVVQDGKINRGEEVTLEFSVQNGGSRAATGVQAEVTTQSPYISQISPGLFFLDGFSGNNSVTKTFTSKISVGPFANWDSAVVLNIKFTDDNGGEWNRTHSFTIESQFIITNGLRAYYTFDRDNASNDLVNSELNNNLYTGTRNNSPAYSSEVPNSSGYSMYFDNNFSQSIIIPNSPVFGVNERTYSFWFKANPGDYFVLSETSPFGEFSRKSSYVKMSNSSTNFIQYSLYINGAFNTVLGSFPISSNSYLNNQWHMLSLSLKDGEQVLYLDGVLRARNNLPGVNIGFASTDYGFMIGTEVNPTTNTFSSFYQGYIDNLRIYNRILSQNEVFQLFNARQ